MSGHSKWSQIKYKKSKEDERRGRIFSKLSRAITIAARKGSDPQSNPPLEAAIQKAKDYNMPSDSIERAIKRGTGEIAEVHYEQITYEGYGPNGVAIMVEVLTDNRNRAASEIRSIFTHHSGNLAGVGSVSWMFDKKGHILIDKTEDIDEDELFSIVVETGAEDMLSQDDHWEVTTDVSDLMNTRKALEERGIKPAQAVITMLPKNTVKLKRSEAKKVLKLVDILEEHDEVQEVYANFDIPDEILEEIATETK